MMQSYLLHRLRVRGSSGGVIVVLLTLRWLAEINMQSVNVFLLARSRLQRFSLRQQRVVFGQPLVIGIIPELMILAHHDAPIRHGALAILARDLAKRLLRLLV